MIQRQSAWVFRVKGCVFIWLIELHGCDCSAMSVDFWRTSGKEMAQPSVVGGLSPAILWTYRRVAPAVLRSACCCADLH